MGPIPQPGWTLDRIDTHRREYGPDLCRWTDKKTQSENRPNTKWVETPDGLITVAELARLAGRPRSTVYAAVDAGKSVEEIVGHTAASSFQPSVANPEEWLAKYQAWLRNDVHRDKRQFAPPEVFELVMTSFHMSQADKNLTDMGYYELLADEVDEAERMQSSPAFLMLRDGVERQTAALASLTSWYPKLADRLTGPAGFNRLTFWKWATFLRNAPA